MSHIFAQPKKKKKAKKAPRNKTKQKKSVTMFNKATNFVIDFYCVKFHEDKFL